MELELDGGSRADAGALTGRGQRWDDLLPALTSRRAPVLHPGELSAAVSYRPDRLLQAFVFPEREGGGQRRRKCPPGSVKMCISPALRPPPPPPSSVRDNETLGQYQIGFPAKVNLLRRLRELPRW